MFMTEGMFIIIGAFVFGNCLGYYSFDIFQYKNRKHEFITFFQVIIENTACSIESWNEKWKKLKSLMTFFLEMIIL